MLNSQFGNDDLPWRIEIALKFEMLWTILLNRSIILVDWPRQILDDFKNTTTFKLYKQGGKMSIIN